MVVTITNCKGVEYYYYNIEYHRNKHIRLINNGKKKSYTQIEEYDIVFSDICVSVEIHLKTREFISNYTKFKQNNIHNILKNYEKTKQITLGNAKWVLKYHIRLYKQPFNTIINELYENTINVENTKKLYHQYLLPILNKNSIEKPIGNNNENSSERIEIVNPHKQQQKLKNNRICLID